jgi:hypothetical protein
MKSICLLALLLLTCNGAYGNEKDNDLQLSTKILKQSYCKDKDSDTTMLLLNLELTYTNVGQQPIILYKGSDQISYVRVARNQEELSSKKYEVDMSVTWVTSGNGDVPNIGSVPDSRFVVLKLGASFKVNGETRIIDSDKLLPVGEHVLQVIVSTWQGSREQAERLRNKWAKTGYFWYGNTFSLPMQFRVESNPKLKRC